MPLEAISMFIELITKDQIDKVELLIIECECGFHMGLDSTYLEQVGNISITCPACNNNHTIEA